MNNDIIKNIYKLAVILQKKQINTYNIAGQIYSMQKTFAIGSNIYTDETTLQSIKDNCVRIDNLNKKGLNHLNENILPTLKHPINESYVKYYTNMLYDMDYYDPEDITYENLHISLYNNVKSLPFSSAKISDSAHKLYLSTPVYNKEQYYTLYACYKRIDHIIASMTDDDFITQFYKLKN